MICAMVYFEIFRINRKINGNYLKLRVVPYMVVNRKDAKILGVKKLSFAIYANFFKL